MGVSGREPIAGTGATRVGVTHGYVAPLVRWLREERGLDAWGLATRFTGDSGDVQAAAEDGEAPAGEGLGQRDEEWAVRRRPGAVSEHEAVLGGAGGSVERPAHGGVVAGGFERGRGGRGEAG